MKGFLVAILFLTRIPLPYIEVSEKDLSNCVSFFPVVGAIEGLITGTGVLLLKRLFSSDILAIFALLVVFFIRGIFHLDGLSDTCDALSIKPSGDAKKDIEKRLRIMKDSTVGVGGVFAVVMLILSKFILFKSAIELNLFFPAIVTSFAISRWVAVGLMKVSKPAKKEGLGYLLMKNIKSFHLIFASIFAFLIVLSACCLAKINFFISFLLFALVFLLVLTLKVFFEKNFGGITGDTLGASIEITEVLSFLIWVSLGQRHSL